MFIKLNLMASHGYPPALVFHPEQGLNRVPKDCNRLLPGPELRQDVIRSGPLSMRHHQNEEPWTPVSGLFEHNQFVEIDPILTKSLLINIQDTRLSSTLFSFDIPQDSTRHEEFFKFMMELQALRSDHYVHRLQSPDYTPCLPDTANFDSRIIYPNLEFDFPKPFMEFVGDLIRRSEVTFNEEGRVSLTEMKNILSVLVNFYLSKNSRKQSMLVPQFSRLDFAETSYHDSSLMLETVTVAPVKSPQKVKLKPSPKKKKTHNKAIKERDLHKTNYLQACESLLSILADKNRNGKSTIPVLKKSGPDLPNLLTQCSATIAGTGLAVLFSVMCKMASPRVPFRGLGLGLVNTGLGLGLVWLSWAVNGLRDAIVTISKNSNKKGIVKEEEMMKNLDTSMKEIYFRAATLMAVMVLRLA